MANQDDDRDDDDEKDADESADEGSAGTDEADEGDDESSDDGEEEASSAPADSVDDKDDEEEEEDAPAAAAAPASPPAAAPTKAKPLSAGARVAAAKAAKAAKKAVKKAAVAEERASQLRTPEPGPTSEEEAEDTVEQIKHSPLGQAAVHAQDWAKANEGMVYGVLGLAAIALVGWFGYNYVTDSNAVAAGALLEEAVRISHGEIREEGEEETATTDEEDDAPTFATIEERTTAALEAYRRVVSEHPSSDAAGWAQLGEARLLLARGEAAEARAAFQAAVSAHGADPVIAMRAYEGVGFTYEDEENWDEANDAFERIRGLEDGDYAAVADYHLARIRLATGDEVGAQTALEELVDSIREHAASSEPEFPYVLAQAQTLLRELDPSSADGAEAPMLGAGGAGGASEEEIMEMIRRAMANRGAGDPATGGE